MRPIVAFQGESGAFSEAAARELIGGPLDLLPCTTFDAAVRMVVDGHADFAAIPVENRIAGHVHAALQALAQFASLERVRDYDIPVHLSLFGLEGASAGQITEVLSHPMALRQCGSFLRRHPRMTAVEAHDTAGAARMVAMRRDAAVGAIAAPWAGPLYGLSLIEDDVQEITDNWTRFTLVRRRRTSGPVLS